MTAYIDQIVLDRGLWWIPRTCTRLLLNNMFPSDYFATIGSQTCLGFKDAPVIAGPSEASPAGRWVTVQSFDDGMLILDGLATHWSLVDDNNEVRLAAGELATSRNVLSGDAFNLESFHISIPGAV